MNLSVSKILLFTTASLSLQIASAITIGQIDTFQTGTTQAWFAGGGPGGGTPPIPPQVIANGGPSGLGDEFLEITASTPSGSGSKVVALNASQWAGNYLAAGVTAIAMDLENLGRTDLTIRLLFENPIPGPPTDEAVTTFGAVLPAGTGWKHFVFPVTAGSLTPIFGNVNTLLGRTTVLRIINASGPTEADTQLGVLGVDNIQATVPEPATFLLAGIALAGLAFARLRRV